MSAVLYYASFQYPAVEVSSWVCENTGSYKSCRTVLSMHSTEVLHVSPLEEFLRRKTGIDIVHRWRWMASRECNVYGDNVVHTDGSNRHHELLAHWVNGEEFDRLPEEEKVGTYEILLGMARSSEQEKHELYSQLLELRGKKLVDFIRQKRTALGPH